jgi:hypothetical protein
MDNPDLYFPELSPIENNYLERNYIVDDGEAVVVISIDLGDGRNDQIKVYEHDDSDQLALDFCHKHKLCGRAKTLLANEIEKNLKVALSRAAALSTPNSSTQSYPSSRPGRNQTFTQRSMGSKQVVTQSVLSPMTSPLKSSRKPKEIERNTRRQNTSIVYQPSRPSSQKRSNKRANSMYEKVTPSKGNFSFGTSLWGESDSSKKQEEKCDKSERLMKKIKYQRYKEIFESLTPDTKGVITCETVSRSKMTPNLKKTLQPLLDELQELNETLDFNEFYDAMEMLLKALTPGDKSALLLPTRNKNLNSEKFDFRPKTNVSRIAGNMSTSSLYDRGLQKKLDFSRRIEKEKETLIEEEMKECRFVPKVSHKRSLSTKSFR